MVAVGLFCTCCTTSNREVLSPRPVFLRDNNARCGSQQTRLVELKNEHALFFKESLFGRRQPENMDVVFQLYTMIKMCVNTIARERTRTQDKINTELF